MSDERAAGRVRAARMADLTSVLRLMEQYWAYEGICGFAADALAPLLRRLLSEPGLGKVWVAEGAPPAELAGYLVAVKVLSLEHRGIMAEIDELFVEPGQRAAGLGSALLAHAEADLSADGCTRVQLQLGIDNESARSFYLRHGFIPRAGYALWDKPLPEGR